MYLDLTALMAAPIIGVSIDIDGTIVVQALVFLASIFLLQHLMFRPYLKTREARKENVEGSSEEAGELDAQAEVLEEKYEEQIRQARRDAKEVRDSLRKQGLAEQQDIHSEVREELDEKLADERAKISAHVQDARAEIEDRAEGLADAMVGKLVPDEG